MKNKIITVGILIIILVGAVFAYDKFATKPLIENTPKETEEENMQTLNIKEQYNDGVYTFVGAVEVPSPCHSLEANVFKGGDMQFTINVITTPPAEGVMCAQVMTEKSFKVSFEGPENAEIDASINGEMYELNRFEIPLSENIETYEIYIKG